MKIIIIAALLFISGALAQADSFVPLSFTFKVNLSVQGAATTNSAQEVTYASPHKYSMTNATFLKLLALDEHAEGNYSNAFFPSGAKLVLLNNHNNIHEDYFIVTDKHGAFLVNVSDLINFRPINNNFIQSGKIDSVSRVATKLNKGFIGEIDFDDTEAGGSTSFYVAGLFTLQTSDTVKAGLLQETTSGTMASGIGDGTFNGQLALITSSASFSGSGTLMLP